MFSVVQWRFGRLLPVGVLNNSTLSSQTTRLDAFRQGLKEIEFNEGRNVTNRQEDEMRCNEAIRLGCAILSLSAATVVGVVALDVTSAVSAPVNSGSVSFVNIDKAPIQLTVTDNVTNDNYTFQLKVGEETRGLKVSGDKNNGFNSNFKWKATGQDAQKKSISRCGTEKRPVSHGMYGRIDVYAVTKIGKEVGSAC